MIKLIIKNPDGSQTTQEITQDTTLSPSKGQQFYFDNTDGSRKYTLNLADGEESVELIFAGNGERLVLNLNGMAELIKQSDSALNEKSKTVLGIMDDNDGMKELNETALNNEFQGDKVISDLKDLLADTTNPDEDYQNGIIIDDFGSLLSNLDAAAAGGDLGQNAGGTSDIVDPSGQVYGVVGRGIGDTFDRADPNGEIDGGENEEDSSPLLIIGDAGTVYEKGLTSLSDDSEVYNGSFSIDSPDGISIVTIGGVDFTLAELIATNTTPSASIPASEGEIVITGFTQIPAGESIVNYEYTLLNNVDHDGELDDLDSTNNSSNILPATSIPVSVTDTDGDTASGELNINIIDDVPTESNINEEYELSPATLDESELSKDGVYSATVNVSTAFGGVGAIDYGADGAGITTYNLSLNLSQGSTSVKSGLFILDNTQTNGKGEEIELVSIAGTVTGIVPSTNDPVFTVEMNSATGELTFKYIDANPDNIWHDNTNSNDEPASLKTAVANTLVVTQTVTDSDEDSVTSGELDIGNGYFFTIEDDGPTAGLDATAVTDAQDNDNNITLAVDESAGVDAPADDNGDRSSKADFSSLFSTVTVSGVSTANYGTDGAGSVAYALSLTNSSGTILTLGSGLYALDASDTESVIDGIGQGDEIIMTVNAITGDIEGKANGEVYFTVSTDQNGVVTFTQAKNIWHENTSNDNDVESIALKQLNNDDVSINLTQTVTDADGDTDSATVKLVSSDDSVDVGKFNILDDGPDAGLDASVAVNNITVDESPVPTAGDGKVSAFADYASNFGATPDYGTDGAGTVEYDLTLTGTNVDSGLTNLNGDPIVMNLVNGDILGTVGNVTYFTISNTGSKVTFTQSENIHHGNTTNHDDSEALDAVAKSILLTQTITDADGDTDTASLDLSKNVFKIEDDGPTASNTCYTDSGLDTNLMVILDVSGSMGNSSGIDGLDRLDASKEAIKQLAMEYNKQGDVAIQLVIFNSTAGTAVTTQWVTYSTGLDEVISLTNHNGTTNYDAALAAGIDAFDNPGKISGAQNVSYFITDGKPNLSDDDVTTLDGNTVTSGNDADEGIQAGEEAIWTKFANDNDINSFSIGIGTGLPDGTNGEPSAQDILDPISYDGTGTGTDTDAIIVTDMSQLTDVLLGTVPSGNLDFSFGTDGAADGPGSKVDGGNYAFTWGDADSSNGLSEITTTGTNTTIIWSLVSETEIVGKIGNDIVVKVEAEDIDTANPTYKIVELDKTIGLESVTIPFTVTDGDGDTAIAQLCIKDITPANDYPTITVLDGMVDEDALVGGSPDADSYDPDVIVVTKDMSIDFGNDGVGTVKFTAQDGDSTSLTSEGKAITLDVTNNGETITGSTADKDVFTIEIIENNGAYSYKFTLLDSVDHPTMNVEDLLSGLSFEVAVTDGNGDVAKDTINIDIADDIPSAEDASTTIDLNSEPVNLVFTLDISGSMGSNVDGKLADAIDAIKKVVAEYEAQGNTVQVQLNTFHTTADTPVSGWMDSSTLTTELDKLSKKDWTNYEDALERTEDNYTPPTNGGQTYIYFLSDGVPTVEMDDSTSNNVTAGDTQDRVAGSTSDTGFIDADRLAAWNTFVNNSSNNISEVFAVGIEMSSDKYLKLVDSDANIVDSDNLAAVLVNTVVNVSGDLDFTYGADGKADGSGAKLDDGKLAFTWGDANSSNNLDEITTTGNSSVITWTLTDGTLLVGTIAGNVVVKVQATGLDTNTPGFKVTEFDKTVGIESIEVPYTITDGDGDSTTANLSIDVPDLVPTSYNETNSLVFGNATTNLLFTLDVSGSMDDSVKDSNDNWTTRYKIAMASVIDTIEAYEANGVTNVNLTFFSTDSTNEGWMNSSDAKAFLNNLLQTSDGSGRTDYYDALNATMGVDFTGYDADQNIAYFLSDGKPNDNSDKIDQDSDQTIKDWKSYVDTNIDKLNVIGVGSGATESSLKIVQVELSDEVIIVTDESTLGDILASTVTASVNGNVLENISGGDGNISIDIIDIYGTTYTESTFPPSGVELDGDGSLTFDFSTGNYTYTAKDSEFTSDISKIFSVTASDEDGDSTTVDVTIDIDITPNASENIIDLADDDTIDLVSALTNHSTTSVDGVDMTDGKSNNLNIDLDDIITLDDDPELDELKIFGESGDKVTLEGGASNWTNEGKEEINGETFNVYQGSNGTSNIKVLIDEDVSIDPDL